MNIVPYDIANLHSELGTNALPVPIFECNNMT